MNASQPEYLRIAAEVEANLNSDILPMWYPRAVDNVDGGFHENYSEDWSTVPDTQKSIVYQSRLTWLAAQAAIRYPERAAEFGQYARHGIDYLTQTFWDKEHGGLYWAVGLQGAPDTSYGPDKHGYGISFAIYAAAAAYHATHDERALTLAQNAFHWLENHAHDSENGGYYEQLTREGEPILPDAPGHTANSVGPLGHKTMNTHIHLLEAFTALYEVWPDAQLFARLREVFEIVRDRVVTPEGYLELYFLPDWTRVDGGDSYGHDVETAFLLAEGAHVLGIPDDDQTWDAARLLVDHALAYGWDDDHDGFFDHGHPDGEPTVTDKIWWVQAEGLNALLLLHERYGSEDPRYFDAFTRQWAFIENYQIDKTHGGWYESVTLDGKTKPGNRKSDGWTECYHQGRATLNVSTLLKKLADR